MLRVYRDPQGCYWLTREQAHPEWLKSGPPGPTDLDSLEPEVSDRIAKLLHADEGATIDDVGRRISNEIFWLYFEEEDM